MDFTTLNPQVLEDISRAKELADIVIVCPHWGTEYSSKISSYQEKWALEMTEAGADVIIGMSLCAIIRWAIMCPPRKMLSAC